MGTSFDKSRLKVVEVNAEQLLARLEEYEAKYKMSSHDFYSKYNRGETGPENPDFIRWASYFDMAARAGAIDSRQKV